MKKWILLIIFIGIIGAFIYAKRTSIDITGYISNIFIGTTDLLSIIEHPENYYGKEVKVIGYPQSSFLEPKFFTISNYMIGTKNEEGKYVGIPIIYEYFYCWKCEITGTIERINACDCQKKDCIKLCSYDKPKEVCSKECEKFDTACFVLCVTIKLKEFCIKECENALASMEWKSQIDNPLPIEYCEKDTFESYFGGYYEKTMYRCKPNSEKYIYYLKVIKVKDLTKK